MINKLNYYITDCVDPYKNLATEKYLMDTIAEDTCTLYLWQNQKTVVIGRNQNPWAECHCSLIEAEGGHLARRLSGGGAVFHDLGNLNFTFLYSTKNHDLTRQLQVVQKACSLAGIETKLSGRNDILANGKKFSGNAFYNSKGKSYHHGTILISADMEQMNRYLSPSKAKLEAKGVKSVKSRTINLSELSKGLTSKKMMEYMLLAFNEVYGLSAVLCESLDYEKISQQANEYSQWDYLYGASIPFTFSCEDRFDWGQINLQLKVHDGVITSAKLYTDSMDWQLSELVEKALLDTRFELSSMKQSLNKCLPKNFSKDIINLLEKQNI